MKQREVQQVESNAAQISNTAAVQPDAGQNAAANTANGSLLYLGAA